MFSILCQQQKASSTFMAEKTMTQKEPFYDCTRYKSCSVNNCPLHTEYPNLYVDPEDQQQKCKISKEYRIRIVEQYPNVLKFNGWTETEVKNKQKWDALPEEEKQRRTERIREVGLKRREQKEASEGGDHDN